MSSPASVFSPAAFAAVGLGAMLGAWARWLLAHVLNRFVPDLPLGTVVANLAGGFIIGAAVAVFERQTDLAPEWRLFLVTGFLGALTTFSSFSAESMALLHRAEYGWALLHAGVHLAGSLLFCFAGYWLARQLA